MVDMVVSLVLHPPVDPPVPSKSTLGKWTPPPCAKEEVGWTMVSAYTLFEIYTLQCVPVDHRSTPVFGVARPAVSCQDELVCLRRSRAA